MPTPKSRVWRNSKCAKTRKRKNIKGQKSPTQALSKATDYHKWNTREQIWQRAKSSIFKKSRKHSLRSRHQNHECGASLNAWELTREKKIDMGEILLPKHCPNWKTSTSEIHLGRFGGGLKVASFKNLVRHWLGSPHLKRECGASLNAQELTREKKVDMGKNLQLKHCPNR